MRMTAALRRQQEDLPQCPRSDFYALPSLEIDGEDFPNYPAIADAYCRAVVDEKIITGTLVRKACKRFLKMRARAGTPRCLYVWSDAWVCDVCSFIEQLPHVESWAGTIELQPWQIWVCAAIYGFRWKDTGKRVVNDATIVVPRKNAKSTIVAALSYVGLLLEGEPGPQILIGSSTLEQAGHVFEPARKMAQKDHDLAEHFKLNPRVRSIYSGETQGEIKTITSVAEAQDGHNPHMVVLEELHAQKYGLYQVMSSAFGARTNHLMLKITTAGRTATGLCWDQWRKAERLLSGQYNNDSEFAVIYTVDKEDQELPYEIRSIKKANPMWGISVIPKNVRDEVKKATNDPTYRGEYLRTRLNVWSNAADKIFDQHDWEKCERQVLESDYAGSTAWVGIDLALKNDMAAAAIVLEDEDYVVAFVRYYIPKAAPALQDPDLLPMYQDWIARGFVTVAGEGFIDLDVIDADVRAWVKAFHVKVIAVDPSFAQQFANRMFEDGLPVVTFKNTAENMSEPTFDLMTLVKSGHFIHDGNPVLAWNAANVVGNRNMRGLILPKKEDQDSPNKIDGIHATIFANACRIQGKDPNDRKKVRRKVYSQRGVHGASPTA